MRRLDCALSVLGADLDDEIRSGLRCCCQCAHDLRVGPQASMWAVNATDRDFVGVAFKFGLEKVDTFDDDADAV